MSVQHVSGGDNRVSKELSGKRVNLVNSLHLNSHFSVWSMRHARICIPPKLLEWLPFYSSQPTHQHLVYYLQFKFPLVVQVSLRRLGFGCRATHKHSERVSPPATGTTSVFGLICHSSCPQKEQLCWRAPVQGLKEARRPTGTHWGEIRKESLCAV